MSTWNILELCDALQSLTVVPDSLKDWSCTPQVYDAPDKPMMFDDDAKNFHCLFDCRGASRLGIFRDYACVV